MKYLALLVAVGTIYVLFLRNSPVANVERAVAEAEAVTATVPEPLAASPAPRTNALKRPIDRTHEVLGQVEKRNGVGEF